MEFFFFVSMSPGTQVRPPAVANSGTLGMALPIGSLRLLRPPALEIGDLPAMAISSLIGATIRLQSVHFPVSE